MSNPTPSTETVVATVATAVLPSTSARNTISRSPAEVAFAIIKANGTKTNAELAAELGMKMGAFNGAKGQAMKLFPNLPGCKPAQKGRSSGDPVEELRKLMAENDVSFALQVAQTESTEPAAPDVDAPVDAPADVPVEQPAE